MVKLCSCCQASRAVLKRPKTLEQVPSWSLLLKQKAVISCLVLRFSLA